MNEPETPTDAEAEQTAWEWFAEAHPHEAHDLNPERFWAFFQKKTQHRISREDMLRVLQETERPESQPTTIPI